MGGGYYREFGMGEDGKLLPLVTIQARRVDDDGKTVIHFFGYRWITDEQPEISVGRKEPNVSDDGG